ncbi:fimbrial protein [Serratia ureilytica]|uniref:fimbrial protein n=1 Tax=Serratia ureilytica TaxID=300181 RepID=UPI001D18B3B5|nr:fimbrial protein [Serratia ureilytica]MCC4106647.1 fimbrial protein [Serratia ureilytica]
MRRRTGLKAWLLTGMLSLSLAGWAKDADMTFHGRLVEPPPCKIDDGQRVEVNFGDRVGVNKVDGVNYRQVLNYQIKCDPAKPGSPAQWALKLSLSGTGTTGFDKNALATKNPDLGVRIYQNDVPFQPGSSLKVDLDSPPRLEAVPVKKAGSTLTEGPFEALATLRADYQ